MPFSIVPLATVAAKAALGVVIFSSALGAVTMISDRLALHRALPDAGGAQGRCAVWFVGSSSIHRWTNMAETMAPWNPHNRGVNGATLDDVRHRFANETVTVPPEAFVLYIGENDIADGMRAEQVARGIAGLLDDQARVMPRTPAFVIAIKPSPTRWSSRPEQLRLNALMREVAARRRVTFLDVGDDLLIDGRPGPFYRDDGIHLSDAGYKVWGRDIRIAFDRAMPHTVVRRCTGGVAVR